MSHQSEILHSLILMSFFSALLDITKKNYSWQMLADFCRKQPHNIYTLYLLVYFQLLFLGKCQYPTQSGQLIYNDK